MPIVDTVYYLLEKHCEKLSSALVFLRGNLNRICLILYYNKESHVFSRQKKRNCLALTLTYCAVSIGMPVFAAVTGAQIMAEIERKKILAPKAQFGAAVEDGIAYLSTYANVKNDDAAMKFEAFKMAKTVMALDPQITRVVVSFTRAYERKRYKRASLSRGDVRAFDPRAIVLVPGNYEDDGIETDFFLKGGKAKDEKKSEQKNKMDSRIDLQSTFAFNQSGGFAGISRSYETRLSELSSEERQKLEQLIVDSGLLSVKDDKHMTPGAADMFYYDFSLK